MMNSQNTTPAGGPRPVAGSGDPVDGIDDAMTGLDGLDSAPTRLHVAAFERVHLALTDALAAIDGV